IPLHDPTTQGGPVRFMLFWSARNRQLQLVVSGSPSAPSSLSPAEVFDSWRGAVHRGSGMNTWGGAVTGFDLRHQVLGDRIFRASYPVFDLTIFFRRLVNHDVHAVLQVHSIGGDRAGDYQEHAHDQKGP